MKASGYFAFFGDVYNLLKSYPEDLAAADEEYWTKTIAEAGKLNAKYQSTAAAHMSKQIIMSVISELERIDKEKRAARCDDPTAPEQTT